MMAHMLGPSCPHGRPGWSSWLLALLQALGEWISECKSLLFFSVTLPFRERFCDEDITDNLFILLPLHSQRLSDFGFWLGEGKFLPNMTRVELPWKLGDQQQHLLEQTSYLTDILTSVHASLKVTTVTQVWSSGSVSAVVLKLPAPRLRATAASGRTHGGDASDLPPCSHPLRESLNKALLRDKLTRLCWIHTLDWGIGRHSCLLASLPWASELTENYRKKL